MKMAAMRKLVIAKKQAIVMKDMDGRCWLGNGECFCAVEEGVQIDAANALVLMDVGREKRDDIETLEWQAASDKFSVMPNEELDEELIPQAAVMYGGELILILMTQQREAFAVKRALIKPAEAKYGLAYGLRRRRGGEGAPSIILKEDMFVSAIVEPMSAKITKEIVRNLAFIGTGEVNEYADQDSSGESAGED